MIEITDLIDEIKNDSKLTDDYKTQALCILNNYLRLMEADKKADNQLEFFIKFFGEEDFKLNVITFLFAIKCRGDNTATIMDMLKIMSEMRNAVENKTDENIKH